MPAHSPTTFTFTYIPAANHPFVFVYLRALVSSCFHPRNLAISPPFVFWCSSWFPHVVFVLPSPNLAISPQNPAKNGKTPPRTPPTTWQSPPDSCFWCSSWFPHVAFVLPSPELGNLPPKPRKKRKIASNHPAQQLGNLPPDSCFWCSSWFPSRRLRPSAPPNLAISPQNPAKNAKFPPTTPPTTWQSPPDACFWCSSWFPHVAFVLPSPNLAISPQNPAKNAKLPPTTPPTTWQSPPDSCFWCSSWFPHVAFVLPSPELGNLWLALSKTRFSAPQLRTLAAPIQNPDPRICVRLRNHRPPARARAPIPRGTWQSPPKNQRVLHILQILSPQELGNLPPAPTFARTRLCPPRTPQLTQLTQLTPSPPLVTWSPCHPVRPSPKSKIEN